MTVIVTIDSTITKAPTFRITLVPAVSATATTRSGTTFTQYLLQIRRRSIERRGAQQP